MSYIDFDKGCLANLNCALSKEIVRSNRAGTFACTTIIGCNTRKYHGLLICPQPAIDEGNHVLLSSVDETIIQNNTEFNLGIHKFAGNTFFPKGHKYCTDFNTDTIPILTYRVGGVVFTKERILTDQDDRMLIRYTLKEANSPTTLRLRPFLAYRNVHDLSKANVYVETKYSNVPNGIKLRMYTGYSYLNIQLSKEAEYIHMPDWYYNFEYEEERERGYDYKEDLYVPGYFEMPIKKGESIVLSVGIDETNPSSLTRAFNNEAKKRTPRNNFENCLKNAAEQFIVKRDKKIKIIAGFPWFGPWGRDTFIALPGLTVALGNNKTCKAVIDTMISQINGALFPNIIGNEKSSFNTADASLWFFWTLQQYAKASRTRHQIWKEYGKEMRAILNGFKDGTEFNIKMLDNGLIYAGENGRAVTWMDAVVEGKPVTPRIGSPVEINALWYNAIMFSMEVAGLAEDLYFVKQWEPIAEQIAKSFITAYWDESKGYLADYVNNDFKDWALRPNQVIACSMQYTPLESYMIKSILTIAEKVLLTPRGLRTLSPEHPDYKGVCVGDQKTRDNAYHQGTVWPWLSGHFAEGYLRIYKKDGVEFVTNMYNNFEETMFDDGIGTVSEIYDGDPPHKARGAISQAWSVAEVIRMKKLVDEYGKIKDSTNKVSNIKIKKNKESTKKVAAKK